MHSEMRAVRFVGRRLGMVSALAWVAVSLAVFGPVAAAAQGPTAEAIIKRGKLLCSGATANSPGFAMVDKSGQWKGMDVDICRAIAVALLGDDSKMTLVPVSFVQRFPALQSGDIDVIVKNTAVNLTRSTDLGLSASVPYFYTGVGVMVHKDLGVQRATDLDNPTVCVSSGTTLEKEAADFFGSHHKQYKLLSFENPNERDQAYAARRCDAVVNGFVQLAAIRAFSTPKAEDNVILPDVLSKEVDSAFVRRGDEQFLNIVNWTIYALIEAEELGLTSANVESRRNDPDPQVRQLLGTIPGVGKKLGLRESWALDVIRTVGNYGEIYNRNLGADSALKLDRGPNRLWNKGGLLFSPPFD